MFGYVYANKMELKLREFEKYRAYYCGLCKVLKDRYGIAGQMTLSYDMTFLVILLTGLYEPESEDGRCKCIPHPVKSHRYIVNEYTEYASDMNILLTYYKELDDWNDEKKISGFLASSAFKRKAQKVSLKYEDKALKIEKYLRELREHEESNDTNIDTMAGIFGKIMSVMFAKEDDEWRDTLSNMGFYIGKYIYILDAYEDIDKDIKNNSYNPFIKLYGQDGFDDYVKKILTMMMAECTRYFERLPILRDVGILRNILYSGVWCRYDAILHKRKEKIE